MKNKIDDKSIHTIDELLELLEIIIDEYSDRDSRRQIIKIIEFAKRQQQLGRTLSDVIFWIQKEMPE